MIIGLVLCTDERTHVSNSQAMNVEYFDRTGFCNKPTNAYGNAELVREVSAQVKV